MEPARGATRIFIAFCAGLGLMLDPASSSAQPTLPAANLARCAEIATDTVRLACFDALARELVPQGNTERAAPQAVTEAVVESMPETESGNEDVFGAELIGESRAQGPDEIQSRLVGQFTGWRGNTTFTLENGQVWRQAEADRLIYRAESPLITIRRGAFDTYRLSVEAVNGSVRVRRIE